MRHKFYLLVFISTSGILMKTYKIQVFFFFILLKASLLCQAQNKVNAAVVRITGEVSKALTVDGSMLQEFKQVQVVRKDKEGNNHQYSGVLLFDLLEKAVVKSDAGLKSKNLNKYVLVEASDGYQVVFALSELDEHYSGNRIILADKIDGKAFFVEEGPFRIIVQNDKKPARCVRQVTAIKVRVAD